MPKSPPDILEFAEYRHYLKERYRYLKLNDRKFSHRFINGKVGLKSSGWFADVLAGRQKLKPAHVRRVAAVFKLNPEEQKCLHALVDLAAAVSPEDCAAAYERWSQIKGIGQETIGKDRFRIYGRWYFTALREVMGLNPGVRDPDVLGSALDPRITAKQAQAAMELLARLGVVREVSAGGASIPMPVLVKDPAARTRHWKRMMASMMKLGRRALDRYGRDERNFSALTLTFSPEGLRKAGEEITALRKRLLYLSEKDKGSDRVYHCLFQVYPVSNPLEASRVQACP